MVVARPRTSTEQRQQEIAVAEANKAIWQARCEEIQRELKVRKGQNLSPSWVEPFTPHRLTSRARGQPEHPSTVAIAFLEATLRDPLQEEAGTAEISGLADADDTAEALADSLALAGGWPVAALAESEGGVVFGGIAMHKEHVMRTFASWNVLWDGGRLLQGQRCSAPLYSRSLLS